MTNLKSLHSEQTELFHSVLQVKRIVRKMSTTYKVASQQYLMERAVAPEQLGMLFEEPPLIHRVDSVPQSVH